MADPLAFLQSLAYGQITKLSLLFVHDAIVKMRVSHIIFQQTFGSARLARKPSLNLITIESQAMVLKISTAKPAASLQFVPSLFLLNDMSLAPKIDEVNSVVINADVNVVCITETWLQSHIPDSVVAKMATTSLEGTGEIYAIHGGVCMHIKVSIPFTILGDLKDESVSFEVLWIKLRPIRLPRGISSIIAGVVYHPPEATNSMMLDYLTKCLMNLESKYPNCGLLVLGDFNHPSSKVFDCVVLCCVIS